MATECNGVFFSNQLCENEVSINVSETLSASIIRSSYDEWHYAHCIYACTLLVLRAWGPCLIAEQLETVGRVMQSAIIQQAVMPHHSP